MKNKIIVVSSVVLVISIVTYFFVISDGSIRTVEFLSFFAIDALTGILLTHIFNKTLYSLSEKVRNE